MTRTIQSGGGPRASAKTFVGHLASALFWIVVAVIFPVRLTPELVPGLAPFAQWAPAVFYALAIWSFIRSARSLQALAAGRRRSASADDRRRSASGDGRPRARGSARPARQDGARTADRGMPAIDRKPTVQRMR